MLLDNGVLSLFNDCIHGQIKDAKAQQMMVERGHDHATAELTAKIASLTEVRARGSFRLLSVSLFVVLLF